MVKLPNTEIDIFFIFHDVWPRVDARANWWDVLWRWAGRNTQRPRFLHELCLTQYREHTARLLTMRETAAA